MEKTGIECKVLRQRNISRNHYLRNQDDILKRQKERRKDPEFKLQYRAYLQRPGIQERKRSSSRKYSNGERGQKRAKKYRHDNADSIRRANLHRRSLEKNAVGNHTFNEFQKIVIMFGNCCIGCWRTDVKITEDHIIPITKDGTDYIDNIQPLCPSCNSSKGNRYDVPNLLEMN